MIKKISYAFASVLGIGYFPFAPGTLGSLVTLPAVWFVYQYYGLEGLWGFIMLAYLLGILSVREVLKSSKHDPSFVVIDEVAGQAMAFVFVPNHLDKWWVYLVGFALFRFFDILKIGPVKWADEKIENETGVMLDDIFAGIFAAVLLYCIAEYQYILNFLGIN